MATLQQKAAHKKLVDLGGKNVSKAMRESAFPYSPKTAKTPKKLTESKGFKQLMNEYLPEGLVAKRHKQMLNKSEKIVVSDGTHSGSHIEDTGQPHSDVNKALDMAYKLRGSYPK